MTTQNDTQTADNVIVQAPADQNDAMFASAEPLWFANGRWGECGYAVPNCLGKTFTNNPIIFNFVNIIGRNMFDLMHREDVKFYVPPHKQFWFDLHQLLITGRKWLADNMIAPNDNNVFAPIHANPTPRVFLVYPIPFFGDRVRQPDVAGFAQLLLMLLSDIMQHSDNERAGYLTTSFASMVGTYLREILSKLAMKFFGAARADATGPAYVIPDAAFAAYDPSKVMTSVELTDERPPLRWWPTARDLSRINGVPMNIALTFCQRWPDSKWFDVGADNVLVNQITHNEGDPNTAGTAAATGSFVSAPNQAP